jgi:hypothetical protein
MDRRDESLTRHRFASTAQNPDIARLTALRDAYDVLFQQAATVVREAAAGYGLTRLETTDPTPKRDEQQPFLVSTGERVKV